MLSNYNFYKYKKPWRQNLQALPIDDTAIIYVSSEANEPQLIFHNLPPRYDESMITQTCPSFLLNDRYEAPPPYTSSSALNNGANTGFDINLTAPQSLPINSERIYHYENMVQRTVILLFSILFLILFARCNVYFAQKKYVNWILAGIELMMQFGCFFFLIWQILGEKIKRTKLERAGIMFFCVSLASLVINLCVLLYRLDLNKT